MGRRLAVERNRGFSEAPPRDTLRPTGPVLPVLCSYKAWIGVLVYCPLPLNFVGATPPLFNISVTLTYKSVCLVRAFHATATSSTIRPFKSFRQVQQVTNLTAIKPCSVSLCITSKLTSLGNFNSIRDPSCYSSGY